MKKIFILSLFLASAGALFAQDSTKVEDTTIVKPKPPKKDWSKVTMNRSNDHFLLQVGKDSWAGGPDSLDVKGLSRSFGIYLMMDFPFKTNPHFSVALGLGVSSSNMYFKDTYLDISGKTNNSPTLLIQNVKDTTHFKKFKLQTSFLEIPVEFRYTSNPENPNKSWKAAVGAKIGTMLSAGTKGKNLLNGSGGTVNSFTQKEKSKRYFNKTRFAVTGRIGYGALSLFTAWQVNAYFKEGLGPDVRPYTIGLTISGL